MGEARSRYLLAMRLLREPVLWFLLLGGVLFGVHRLATDPAVATEAVEVPAALVDALARNHRIQTGKDPDSETLRTLVDDWVTDEALYREALRQGLHLGDPVVRRRLVQLIEFGAEDRPRPPPTEAELASWLASHPAAFRTPDRIKLVHAYFGDDEAAATSALARLRAGEPVEAVGGRPFVHGLQLDASLDHLKTLLGQRFADAVSAAATGTWIGPVRSSYGLHLVQVEGRTPGKAPTLAEVRPAVEAAWHEAARHRARAAIRDDLRRRVDVSMPPQPKK